MACPFRIVTQNVQSRPLMPQAQVRSDVAASADVSDLVLWQEIGPPRYTMAVESLASPWHAFVVAKGGTPISWRSSRIAVLDTGSTPLHGGATGICSPQAMARGPAEPPRPRDGLGP